MGKITLDNAAGRYRSVRTLGSGSFGEVVCAEQIGPAGFRRLVALKRPHGSGPQAVERLLREARIGGLLRHENIVGTLDVGRDDAGWYLVLEYVDGVTLATVIDRHRAAEPIPAQGALELALQLCAGLEHAHRARDEHGSPLGLVHGDLSPANVLLSRDGHLKIADFGAARSALDEPGRASPRGTPGFGAPELATGAVIDHRADVYSAGAILGSLFAVSDADSLPAVGELLAWATAGRPDDRPATAGELRARLWTLRAALPPGEPLAALAGSWTADVRTLTSDGADWETPPPLPPRPFRGLESFGAESAALFFGRQDDARRLADRIREQPLVVLTGASGAGKSSLLAAGLPAHLPDLAIVRFRPGRDPVASLARALGVDEEHVAAEGVRAPTLIVVDQGEELLTLSAPDRRAAATRALAALAASKTARVLISVRADFLAALCDVEALRGACRTVEVLTLPSREQLTDALTRPLEPFGCRFESPALVDRIVTALAGQPGSLALLQFCADRLWDARDQAAGVLREADYEAMGGVEGALATYADGVLAELAPAEQDVARRILLRCLQGGTRHPVEVDALVRTDGDRAAAVLHRLVEARLLTRRSEPDSGPVVEPAHEALIGHWRRLDLWVAQDAAARRLLDELVHAAERWERAGRSPDRLWRGDLLAEWRRHAPDLTDHAGAAEQAFVEASERHERRRRRRQVAAVAVSMTALLGLAVLATAGWRSAQQARTLTEKALERSETDALLTRSAWERERGDTGRAVRIARRVLEQDPGSARAVAELYAAVGGRGERAILTGHDGTVRDGAFSPDGSLAITVGMDGTTRLWDRMGTPVLTVKGEDGPIYMVRFHPGGQRCVTAAGSGLARIRDRSGATLRAIQVGDHVTWASWDPTGERMIVTARDGSAALLTGDGQPLAELRGHTKGAFQGAFSPDGALAVTVSLDGEARVWTRDGALVRVVSGLGDCVWAGLSPDGSLLTASWPGTVQLWGPDGRERAAVHGLSRYTVAAWNPTGTRFAAGSPDDAGAVALLGPGGEPLTTLSGHRAPVFTVAFAPRGGRLASASEDGEIRVWSESGEPVAVLAGHERRVWALAWSPDGEALLSVSEDGTARLWDAEGRAAGRLAQGEPVDACPLDPTGQRVLALVADDGAKASVLRLYAVGAAPQGGALAGESAVLLRRWTAEGDDTVTAARWRPDGGEAALLRADGRVQRVDRDGGPLGSVDAGAPVRAMAFTPHGALLTGGADGRVARWTDERSVATAVGPVVALSASSEERGVAGGPDGAALFDLDRGARPLVGATAVLGVCSSSDGQRFAATGRDGTAWLWDADGAPVTTLRGHRERTVGCAWHPTSGRFATASWDGTARIWSRDGALLEVIEGHTREVDSADWSPDGSQLLTGSWDGTATLRDGRGALATLSGHGGEVVHASWSDDGGLVATCARGGQEIRLWPGNQDELLRWAARLVPEKREGPWAR